MLQRTIDGILALPSPVPVHVVVVGDGEDIHVRGHLRVSTVSTLKRLGVAAARNLGALLAPPGGILVFTDGHVAFSPNYIRTLLESDIAATGGVRGCRVAITKDMDFHGAALDGTKPLNEAVYSYAGWRLANDLNTVAVQVKEGQGWGEVPFVGGCCLAIMASEFKKFDGFDGGLVGFGSGEDMELCCRVWGAGRRVLATDAALVWHYTEPRTTRDIAAVPLAPLDPDRYSGETYNKIRVFCTCFDRDAVYALCRRTAVGQPHEDVFWEITKRKETLLRRQVVENGFVRKYNPEAIRTTLFSVMRGHTPGEYAGFVG